MQVMGVILRFFYNIVPNYGVSLILFTIVIKILLIPLTVKQQKSTLKMQRVQPLIKELQEKYKNDKEKLNMETMKLYKEHGANPLAGCLPMLIQMPILLSLWWVIRSPITYMMGIDLQYLIVQLNYWIVEQVAARNLVLQLHEWIYNAGWAYYEVAPLSESLIAMLQDAF